MEPERPRDPPGARGLSSREERAALGFLVASPVALFAGLVFAVWAVQSSGWGAMLFVLPATALACFGSLAIGLALDASAKRRRRRENERGWH